jgi:hypothetical protein
MRKFFVAAALLAASGSAYADYTTVNGPAGGELGHGDILSAVYGATLLPSGLDFSGGGITATRVQDRIGGLIGANLVIAGPNLATQTDQIWQDGTVRVRAEAKFAGDDQSFGWIQNTTNVQNFLFTAGSVPQNASFNVGGNGEFRLYDDPSNASLFESRESNNSNIDHMVTYFITGTTDGIDKFFVFFEDRASGDFDYNDLGVELSVVPLPPAAWAGLVSLAGVGGFGYLRRRRLNVG